MLPVPQFFDPANAGRWAYRPDQGKVRETAFDWRSTHHLKASQTDKKRVHVLAIDLQKDFCFPEGSLYVAGRSGTGAIDDSRRTAEWIYRNLDVITQITTTLDTHFAYQIFFSSFLVHDDGSSVPPHTVVTLKDVTSGRVRPSPAAAAVTVDGNYQWACAQLEHYCSELERVGKYKLYVWPEHCLLGSDGHALVGVIHEARMFHAFARSSQSTCEVKGGHPWTENYSVLRPEVLTRHDGQPLAQKNVRFVRTLFDADYVVPLGQAASHCVKSSIEDLLDEILTQDPALARKVYVLEDCMSAVTVPDGKGGFVVDYTDQAEAALKRFSDAGMHVVKSTDPIDRWPDFVL